MGNAKKLNPAAWSDQLNRNLSRVLHSAMHQKFIIRRSDARYRKSDLMGSKTHLFLVIDAFLRFSGKLIAWATGHSLQFARKLLDPTSAAPSRGRRSLGAGVATRGPSKMAPLSPESRGSSSPPTTPDLRAGKGSADSRQRSSCRHLSRQQFPYRATRVHNAFFI